MPSSNFVDYVKIFCRSGKGGAGSAHLHRAKYLPKGGPDGGDGGRGGHVILRGNKNYWTLIHLKYARHVFAGDGGSVGESRSFGKNGEDKIIDVPCGTIAYDGDTGEFLAEISDDKQEVVLLKGGRGGLGNWHFRSATNQTPRYAQPGEPRVERNIILELKVLADVGLVGFPNAGKSTLLSVVSAAKPEIANYPFTTLTPNLGIVSYRDNQSFCMADIPGIIEGAAEGKGLGLRFLRHIERNSVLLFLVPADSDDIAKEYGQDDAFKFVNAVFFSSVSGLGLDALKDVLWEELNKPENRVETITHRNLDVKQIDKAEEIEEDDDFQTIYGVERREPDIPYDIAWDAPENLKKEK